MKKILFFTVFAILGFALVLSSLGSTNAFADSENKNPCIIKDEKSFNDPNGPKKYAIGIWLITASDVDYGLGSYDLVFWVAIVSQDHNDMTKTGNLNLEFVNGNVERVTDWDSNPNVYKAKFKGTFLTKFDFRYFPFHQTNLPIIIEPGLSVTTKNVLTTKDVILVPCENSGFDKNIISNLSLQEIKTSSVEYSYGVGANRFSRLTAEIITENSFRDSLVTKILPVLTMIGVAYAALLFREDAGDRMGFTIASMLTLVFFHIYIRDQLPVLRYATLMDIILICGYLNCAATIFIIAYRARKKEQASKVQ